MKNLFLLLLVFVQFTVIGQKQVKNANKAFQKESYLTASKIYENAVNNGDVTPELLRNLADSYFYNARYAESANWYAKLFQLSSEQTAEYYCRYAQALKSAQQAVRADSVMAVYCTKFPNEIRAKNYLVKQNYFFENNPFLAIRLKNLEINSAYSDYGATIHGDSIYFASARPEILEPEEYERTQQPFTNLFLAKFIDTNVFRSKLYDNGKTFSVFHESTPTFSADGKTLYYTKNELVSKKNKTLVNGRYRIYKSIYKNGKWIDKGVVNIKTNDSCRIAHPALSPDNKRLYFASDMKGTYGQSDIYYVDLYDNDSVSLPVNLGTKVNTEGRDSYPFISQDNQLFFASDGHPGMGGFDVFVIDLNVTQPRAFHLGVPINSSEDDFAFVWKKDLYKAVLTSNRSGGQGDDDIYAFALPKPIEPVVPPAPPAEIFAMGTLTDAKTGAVLGNSSVVITDATGKVVSTITTDAAGNYSFPIVAGQTYQLAYVSNGYESAQQTVSVPVTQKENSTIAQQLRAISIEVEPIDPLKLTEPLVPAAQSATSEIAQQLTPISKEVAPIEPVKPIEPEVPAPAAIFALGTVMDAKTGAVLGNSTVVITDATGKVVSTITTDAAGNYSFPIVAGQTYQLALTSAGYESAQQTVSVPVTQKENSTIAQQLRAISIEAEPIDPLKLTEPLVPAAQSATSEITQQLTAIAKEDSSIEPVKPFEPIAIGTDLAKVYEIKPIYFDVNKALIRPDAAIELDKIVAILNENPTMEIELGSHTDCRSTASYNQSLSNRRAKASAAYIKARISDPERITGKGYGESQLLNNCYCEDTLQSTCSDEEHQLNRRTEFKVIGYKTEKPVRNQEPKPIVQKERAPLVNTHELNPIKKDSLLVSNASNKPDQPLTIGTDLAKVYEIKPIYFDVNKALIRPDAAIELDKIVAILNENPTMEIELGSHTDCRSTASYNQSLSNRRAKASAAYIKARISNPKRITGKGYGESQLLNNCFCEDSIQSTCSDEEHQLNRRTEFKVIGYNGVINTNSKPAIVREKEFNVKPNLPIDQPQKTADKLDQTTYPEGFVIGADLSKLLKINMIYFDLDKYSIRPDAALELDKIVAVMKQYPNLTIELISHTDCRMPEDYNQRLSNIRARKSKSYLVAHGIKSSRITGKGLGESQLAVDCPCEGAEQSSCTEEQHQLNRRTEFIILSL